MAKTILSVIRLTCKALKQFCSYLLTPKTNNCRRQIPRNPSSMGKRQWRATVLQKIRRRSKHLQNEAKSQLSEAEYLSLSLEELGCSICLETIIFPTSVPCGHSFCLKCLDESLSVKSQCPNCRSSIAGHDYSTNHSLSQALNTILPRLDPLIRTNYEKRVAEGTVWRDKREVNCLSIEPGMLFDIKDSQNIWCKARVLQTYPDQSILIHFQRWDSHYDEIIELPSWRLAQPGFYTDRKEITHYYLPDTDHMTARLVRSESQQATERRAQELQFFSQLLSNRFVRLGQRQPLINVSSEQESNSDVQIIPQNLNVEWWSNSDNSDEQQS